jgi:hypothetical protein
MEDGKEEPDLNEVGQMEKQVHSPSSTGLAFEQVLLGV